MRYIQPFGSKVKKRPNNKTKTRSQKTYHLVLRVGIHGTSPALESSQPWVKKCTSGSSTSSKKKKHDSNQAQGDLPAVSKTTKKEKYKRHKWRRKVYIKLVHVFYISVQKPARNRIKNTFKIWGGPNANVRMNLNESRLANERRDIMNKERLADFEFREINEQGNVNMKEMDTGNIGIRGGDVDDKGRVTGGVICRDTDTGVTRTRYVDKKKC